MFVPGAAMGRRPDLDQCRLRKPPSTLPREFDGVPLVLPGTLPFSRSFPALAASPDKLGAKEGLEVVPPIATGMPFFIAAAARPPSPPNPAAPPAPPGIIPARPPNRLAVPPPAAGAALPALDPPTKPVSFSSML